MCFGLLLVVLLNGHLIFIQNIVHDDEADDSAASSVSSLSSTASSSSSTSTSTYSSISIMHRLALRRSKRPVRKYADAYPDMDGGSVIDTDLTLRRAGLPVPRTLAEKATALAQAQLQGCGMLQRVYVLPRRSGLTADRSSGGSTISSLSSLSSSASSVRSSIDSRRSSVTFSFGCDVGDELFWDDERDSSMCEAVTSLPLLNAGKSKNSGARRHSSYTPTGNSGSIASVYAYNAYVYQQQELQQQQQQQQQQRVSRCTTAAAHRRHGSASSMASERRTLALIYEEEEDEI